MKDLTFVLVLTSHGILLEKISIIVIIFKKNKFSDIYRNTLYNNNRAQIMCSRGMINTYPNIIMTELAAALNFKSN